MTRNNLVRYAKIAQCWRDGASIEEIAEKFSTNVNTAGSWVRRARILLGVELVPERIGGPKIGDGRNPSAIDEIRTVGDAVQVPLREIGTRQSLHQAAHTRGWKIKARRQQEHWAVIAVEAVPPLAVRRRKTSAVSVSLLLTLRIFPT